MAAEYITFKISPENLTLLLSKIKDLTKIDSRIILKFEPTNLLMFSFVGDSFKNIHAFKNYVFNIDDVMKLKEPIEKTMVFIVKDGKKLYRTLENIVDYNKEIIGKIHFNDENYVNFIHLKNEKMDIKVFGTDPIAIGKEISIEDINYLMDIENSIFNFRVEKYDFDKIRKTGLIENELDSVLYIYLKDKKLSIGETKWSINICDVENDNLTLALPKKYFNTINPSTFIDIYVFDGFILCKYDECNLMIILETGIN